MDSLQTQCKKVRSTMNPTVASNKRWDMPRVVCSCGKPGKEIISRDGCRSTIKAKNCHKKLIDEERSIPEFIRVYGFET